MAELSSMLLVGRDGQHDISIAMPFNTDQYRARDVTEVCSNTGYSEVQSLDCPVGLLVLLATNSR